MSYHVLCQYGRTVPVEVWHCGVTIAYPDCRTSLEVPDLMTLKRQSGEAHPTLSPLDKLAETFKHREPPFDGRCHDCEKSPAEDQVPITIDVMAERISGTERWRSASFPLLLCEPCFSRFVNDKRRARNRGLITYGSFAAFMAAMALFLWLKPNALRPAVHVAVLVVGTGAFGRLLMFLAQNLKSRRIGGFLWRWVSRIQCVPKAIAGEDEFWVRPRQPEPIRGKWRQ